MSTAHSHRPSLKQSNKAFKSKHASKGSLKTASKGRVPTGNEGNSSNGKRRSGKSIVDAAQVKANRRNHAKQIQAQKRAAVAAQNKLTKGAEAKAPRVVAVIQLCEDVDNTQVVTDLLSSAGMLDQLDTSYGVQQVELNNPRARLQFLTPKHGDLMANLDAVATADFTIFAISGNEEVGAWGETCIRSLASLGMGEGSVRGVVCNLPENPAAVTQVRKSLLSFLKHFFPALERVFSPSIPSEVSNLLRSLGDKLPKGVLWRESRARLLAEEVGWIPEETQEQPVASTSSAPAEDFGTLTFTGVIRGSNFSANRLVHIQGFGDYQVEKIVSASTDHKQKKRDHNAMDDAPAVGDLLSEPTEEADDMVSTNVPSEGEDLMNEQTWPTEEEIAAAPANVHRTFGTDLDTLPGASNGTTPKRLIRVPKGTSAYQAKWLAAIESDEEDEDDLDDEDGDVMDDGENAPLQEDDDGLRPSWEADDEEYEYIDPDATDSQARGTSTAGGLHQDLPMDVENAQYETYMSNKRSDRSKREKESKDDLEFPDEVDTPLEIPARERFARYRGLKSFRTSAWDPYENLPRDYARCFMFQDYKIMGRKLAQRAAEEGVEPGTRVTIYIKNVPRAALQRHSPSHPLVVFGLLQHEHKFSILNFTTTRNTEFDGDIRSKDELIVQLGCRRFVINPLWSQHTQGNAGKGSNNVHKFERYLRPGPNAHVGTAYMPITFGSNVPALIFKDTSKIDPDSQKAAAVSGGPRYQLVGTGSLLGVDPTRIIAKRIILTGHPYKVHKKTATIRYMFFNQPDVDYFKPIELRTKKGRTGHIRESLGTHGYFKAGFDGQIDMMDTICLNLYKRCFPKWARYWTVTEQEGDLADRTETDGHAEDVAMV